MHAVPGGQNPDWHSDNPTSYAAFWDYKDHQDRTIWLWEQIAARYRNNPWVAGYNPLNEPCDPEHVRLPAFYARVEKAIRKIDPDHILWLDGNTFAMEWKGFDEVLPNSVYAMHDYSVSFAFLSEPVTMKNECRALTRSNSSQWASPPAIATRAQLNKKSALNAGTCAKRSS